MGLYLIKQFFTVTGSVEKQVTADIQKEIERRLLETGDRVAIPLNKETVTQGGSKAFGLGILNVLGAEDTFYVKMEYSGHYTLDGDIVEGSLADPGYINDNWIFSNIPSQTLKNNEQAVLPLTVQVGRRMSADTETMVDSTYVFNVCVFKTQTAAAGACQRGAQDLYTNRLYKIYVDVK